MNLTDTHTHLYSEAFDEDRDEAIQNAISQGVSRFFLPAIDASYIPKMLQLKKDYPENIYLMAGLHPTHVNENYLEELDAVEKMLDEHACVAVGETGVDLYWDKTYLTQQQDAFQKQIRLAKQRKLPIVIHCRDAFEEVFDVLEAEKSEELFGIFHCFTGTLEQAKRAISLKMKLGIGGVVTFKNGKLDQFLHEIDLNQIVLETDSPYLAPAPHRGKRNESSYLNLVCQKVAEIYGLSAEEIARQTSANADAIFRV